MGTHTWVAIRLRTLLLVVVSFLISLVGYAQGLQTASISAVDARGSAFARLEPLSIDSLALVALYNATDGQNWRRSAGWLTGSLSSGEWENVEIRHGRVVALALASNNISGQLPRAIGDLTALRTLSLDGNKLEGVVPDELNNLTSLKGLFLANNELTGLPSLQRLTGLLVADVSQNNLAFADLILNRRLADVLRYDSQKEFGTSAHVTIQTGDPIHLHLPLTSIHANDRYVWYRDGEIVGFESQLQIHSASPDDSGIYVLEITNVQVPNLAVRSHPIVVEITERSANTGIRPFERLSSFRFSGDLQLRAEMDRSFSAGDGSRLPDQDRLLVRLGIGFDYSPSSRVRIGGRVRTNSSTLPRSHVALGDDTEGKGFSVHRAFAAYSWVEGEVWLGKYEFPFWMQTEVLWDRDTTPEGFAAHHSVLIRPGLRVSGTASYFLLEPSGDVSFKDMSRLAGAQATLWRSGPPVSVRAGLAFFDYSHNASREDLRLGDRNYHIAIASLELSLDYRVPVSLGTEVLHNMQDYPMKVQNRDGKSAWTLKAALGELGAGGDWRFAYTYSRVEEFAVAGGYAWEERIRSTSDQYQATNFSGHEVYLAADLTDQNNVGVRIITSAPLQRLSTNSIPPEGTRIQVEWNLSF